MLVTPCYSSPSAAWPACPTLPWRVFFFLPHLRAPRHVCHALSRLGLLSRWLHAGPKESVRALAWHPLRSCLLSASGGSGRVYVWARQYAENWSAFAPDFKELDENVEYVEKEDEFDWATPVRSGCFASVNPSSLPSGWLLS